MPRESQRTGRDDNLYHQFLIGQCIHLSTGFMGADDVVPNTLAYSDISSGLKRLESM